ncbi:hypothetical protein [Longimicrobium sp.]
MSRRTVIVVSVRAERSLGTALFLTDFDSSYVIGTELVDDGGLSRI